MTDVSKRRVRWEKTGDPHFPWAAQIDGVWWTLRLNDFPDHPVHTLFIDGRVCGDLEDTPRTWKFPPRRQRTKLGSNDSAAALTPVRHLRAYGSETGHPCDNLFCWCAWVEDDDSDSSG